MPRAIATAVLLVSATALLANAGPPPIPCEREVKLAKPAPGYAFYTLRVADKAAGLEPAALSADRWSTLPIRLKGQPESGVELYCIPTDEAKRYATAGDLLPAIRANKVPHASLAFGTTARSAFYWHDVAESTTCRTREVIAVDKAGKMTAESAVIEPAPEPRRISRLMLMGSFAALSLLAGGLWVWRRK